MVDPRSLDLLAAAMLPAEETLDLGGWLVRVSPHLPFRRCNAVLPYGRADAAAARGENTPATPELTEPELSERIADVERHYRQQRCQPRFQLVPGHSPANLDIVLSGRGYVIEAPVDVLVADPATVSRSMVSLRFDVHVEVRDRLDRDLAERLCGSGAQVLGRALAYDRLIGAAGSRGVVALARRGPAVLSVGFAVSHQGWVGIFGMYTSGPQRRQGGAAAVLNGLSGWAAEQGAQGLMLQVETDNAPALALY